MRFTWPARSKVGEPARLKHDARLQQAAVVFTFNYSINTRLDIQRYANKLLNSEIAETITEAGSDEVRVSPRYLTLATLVQRSERLARIVSDIDQMPPFLWLLRHPRIACSAYRRARSSLRQFSDDEITKPAPSAQDEPIDVALDTAEMIRLAVAREQYVGAVTALTERRLYSPSYLNSQPYVRLGLRSCNIEFRGFNDCSASLDTTLLVHRSGVVQLQVSISLPDDLSPIEVLPFTRSDQLEIQKIEVPENLLRLGAPNGVKNESWAGSWRDEVQAGQRWREIDVEPNFFLQDLVELYRSAIEAATKTNFDHAWMVYPTLFAEPAGCCGSRESWEATHRTELLHLVTRFQSDRLRIDAGERLMPEDRSIVNDSSAYLTLGFAVVLHWEERQVVDLPARLNRMLVIENCLLQYWQLLTLLSRIRQTPASHSKQIREVQMRIVYGLDEWASSTIMFGTARDDSEALLDALGAPRLYQNIQDALSGLAQLQSVEDSRRASIRSTFYAVTALLLSLTLGLPAIFETVKIVSQVDQSGFASFLTRPLRGTDAASIAWEIFLSVLALVVICALFVSRKPGRWRHHRVSRRRIAGSRWPWGTLTIRTQDDLDED